MTAIMRCDAGTRRTRTAKALWDSPRASISPRGRQPIARCRVSVAESSSWLRVARPFVIQHSGKVAHINPAPIRRALNEVLSLVLRLAPARFADDGLGRFHRRLCRSNDVCALWASTSTRSAACSGVSPEMKALRHARSSRTLGESPLRSSSAAFTKNDFDMLDVE